MVRNLFPYEALVCPIVKMEVRPCYDFGVLLGDEAFEPTVDHDGNRGAQEWRLAGPRSSDSV